MPCGYVLKKGNAIGFFVKYFYHIIYYLQGDKNIIKFDGDHNSSRPQFYYDSVSIFFYNVLHPPQVSSVYPSKLDKYYDLGDLKISAGMDEVGDFDFREVAL